MIENFELKTAPISEEEKPIVLALIPILWKLQGKENAKTFPAIHQELVFKGILNVDGARFRKMVNYIRLNGFIPNLIATSSGYYRSDDVQELESYLNSLTGRIDAIAAVRSGIENYLFLAKSGRTDEAYKQNNNAA